MGGTRSRGGSPEEGELEYSSVERQRENQNKKIIQRGMKEKDKAGNMERNN